jgi:hypothetical protein
MLKNLRRNLSEIDTDDVLERLGLESRRSPVEKFIPGLAVFGAGVLIGVGLGMLLAPKSGTELRGELQSGLKRGQRRAKEELRSNGEHVPAPSPAPVRPA